MVKPLWQKDPLWQSKRIGNSGTTLGRDGCTICSCCMALEKLRGYFCSPKNAAYYWVFNRRGEINWKKTNFNGMKFITRGYYRDLEKIGKYANDGNSAAIIEVNHNHWLYVEAVKGKTISIIDPIDGKKYKDLPSKYSITGYALFEAVPFEVPDWLKPLWEKAQKKGLKLKDPAMNLDMGTLLESLKEMRLIDKPKNELKLGEFIAAIDKIKERW